MDTPFLSEIALFAFGYAPRGWATCAGQLLPINQNQALFALLGTTYGGNGQTTFALPDLRGRVPVGGPANLGAPGGVENVTLNVSQLPAHSHVVDASALTGTAKCKDGAGNQRTPVGNVPAIEAAAVTATYSNLAPNSNMQAGGVAIGGTMSAASVGGSQAHTNRQPSLALSYCIALQGIFPSQN